MKVFLTMIFLISIGLNSAYAQNAIVAENQLPGTPASQWDLSGRASTTLEGFTTDISVNHGSTVHFKIKSGTSNWRIDIYRLGYYQGNGARLITTINKNAAQTQPTPVMNAATGEVDAGNWAVTASWAVPSTAVSGVYTAHLVDNTNPTNESHIPFIVRADESTSDIVFQTADTTWQAYNGWGTATLAANLYGGNGPGGDTAIGRAYKVSYNRPIGTRDAVGAAALWVDYLFGAEYAAIYWLEQNGYDVSYIAGADVARAPALLTQHKAFTSTGHDEYWDTAARANVEAARAAGLNLVFMSGNEVYWKTRWEPSIDGSATPYRTLVCYKETRHHAPLDPLNTNPTWTWTGTWRDPRFSPPADGGKPENNLTGTIFQVDSYRSDSMEVPYAMSRFRFWRNTPNVSTLTPGSTWTSTPNLLGYEWDIAPDNGFAPASLINLSSATINVNQFLLDYGSKTGNGTATHNLTLYRHPGSGALVFGAGTVFWAWGLSAEHDGPVTPTDPDVQQATVNLLAEMGVQPGSLQPGLIAGVKSTDTTPPSSAILTPGTGASFSEGQPVTITGTASDSGGQVAGVEVSVDGGTTWRRASGTTNWSYIWTATAGPHTIRSRATDDSLNTEAPQAGDSIVVAASASLFGSTVVPESETLNDNPVELGVRFSASTTGTISGIRFWKNGINWGPHTANLWTSGGTLLASATFANETASGWQVVLFPQPVPITPGITYVASYHSNSSYSATSGFFVAPHTNGPLTANGGVYAYGSTSIFPNQTFQLENYWVDVLFVTGPPPTLQSIATTPANPTILTGVQQPFTATGTYSDGSTQNITSQVTWTSSSPSVATINAAGLATGISAGSSSISAALSGRTGSTGLTVQAAPLTVATTALPSGMVGKVYLQTLSATGGTLPYTWSISTGTLPPGLALNATTGVISGTPTATGTVNFTVRVQDNVGASVTKNLGIVVAPPSFTIWPSTTVPGVVDTGPDSAVQVGVKFRADYDGTIAGVRFYKASTNTGTHVGNLWSCSNAACSSGTLLASAIFSNETASGWQQVNFATPVVITANTVYVASYHTNTGHYSADLNYFATAGVDNAPLHALANGVSGGNGVYAYGTSSAFPAQVFSSANYWVDVAFDPSGTLPLTIATTSLPGATVGTTYTASVAANGGTQPYTWSISAGTLPSGLNLSAAGQITGTLTTAGTSEFTVQVQDASGATTTKALSITVASTGLTIWPSTTAPLLVDAGPDSAVELGVKFRSDVDGAINGIRFYKGVSNTGTHVGNLWTSSGTLLASAIFRGETASGWQQVDFATPVPITANTVYVASYHTNVGHYSADQAFFTTTGVDNLPLRALANGVSGGNGVFAYGTTSVFPTSTFNSSNYWVDVVLDTGPQSLTITSPSLPSATVGTAYTASLAASGGTLPYTWSMVAGSALPAGLSLNAASGVISGTPTAAGTVNFTVRVTDSASASVTQALSIVVADSIAMTTTSLPGATVGTAYTASLAASGGTLPYTWSMVAGSALPAGLSLNAASGVISGTPTAAGTVNFTVRVTDSASASVTQALSIVVADSIAMTTTSLPGATVGTAYTASLAASGGTQPYTWSMVAGSALPAGLSLNAASGVISGTPTAAGTVNFTVRVTDSASASVTQALSIVVANSIAMTTTSLPGATVGTAYTASLAASGGTLPYTWSMVAGSALPAGLSLNAASGVISGTPTAAGTVNFTVRVTDSASATVTRALSIIVANSIAMTTTSLPGATVGTAYTASLAASGGTQPYTWSMVAGSALPAGLSLNAASGVISGTPTAAGTVNFTVRVTDSASATVTQALSIAVVNSITNTGFRPPSANAPVTTSSGDNNGFETTPANAYATDGLFAVDTLSGTNTNTTCTNTGKDRHVYSNYGFPLSGTPTIRGIEVRLTGRVSSTLLSSSNMCVQLSWNGGTSWTTTQSTANLTTTNTTYTLGGTTNTWGRTWAAGDFSNANFRVRIIDVASSTLITFSLDSVAVRVTYQ